MITATKQQTNKTNKQKDARALLDVMDEKLPGEAAFQSLQVQTPTATPTPTSTSTSSAAVVVETGRRVSVSSDECAPVDQDNTAEKRDPASTWGIVFNATEMRFEKLDTPPGHTYDGKEYYYPIFSPFLFFFLPSSFYFYFLTVFSPFLRTHCV